MKVNNPNLSSAGSAGTAKPLETTNTGSGSRTAPGQKSGAASTDDVHLSELVRSLRSLASDSPDRQAKIEAIARSYANGSYQVDAQGTASKIIDDAHKG
jgi:flagellar biosynthesis anti-sigma factor FlgM